ncbi:hypothetical protein Thivi_3618 [Thiocystis violascens DSM 198]|uniref:Uncharacterized protein n=1 Tax=Thiocystis violascens (strain ATCC 17096 / DSM 198 / 6111) TaxID=765911 RepID=I3YEQ4_THIV6|nr:hypothetical protein Thivi_3618 [Thiocystis violascens DSM 198]
MRAVKDFPFVPSPVGARLRATGGRTEGVLAGHVARKRGSYG